MDATDDLMDSLNATAQTATTRAAQKQTQALNSVLWKIIRAANGHSVISDDDYFVNNVLTTMAASCQGHLDSRLTAAERTRMECEKLRETVLELECRLAAVRAVAESSMQ